MNPYDTQLKKAIELAKEEKLIEARFQLRILLKAQPNEDRGWYLLALLSSSRREKLHYYQQCLRLNPNNQRAADKLQQMIEPTGVILDGHNSDPLPEPEVHQHTETKTTGHSDPIRTKKSRKKILSSIKKTDLHNLPILRIFRFLLSRALMITATIFVGVFITVVIVNHTGQFDTNVENEITNIVNRQIWNDHHYWDLSSEERETYRDVVYADYTEAVGLNLPFLPRHLRWTFRSLTFQWGDLNSPNTNSYLRNPDQATQIKDVILTAFPNTLLLMGTGYLLVFIIGLPLALFLSQNNGHWLDKVFTFLSPLSSIPGWVHGILLILLIGIPITGIPIEGMYDMTPPDSQIGYLWVIARHMLLPVLAIILSLIFNLVYTWRTYFLIYSEEEYVELARAKGLPGNRLHKKYILRPGMPYVITSFALTLVSFWQTLTALEVVFRWPGIGLSYVKSLPNFFGESMYSGELLISIAIVVIFAYLLGIIVFLLDVLYIIIDPRIRLGNQEDVKVKIKFRKSKSTLFQKKKRKAKQKKQKLPDSPQQTKRSYHQRGQKFKEFWHEIIKYPSAIFGFSILILFFIGSAFVLIAYPYQQAGQDWYTQPLSGKAYVPNLAKPAWTNLFRKNDLPETIILNSNDDNCRKDILRNPDKNDEITITCSFDYDYADIPQDIYVYYTADYKKKNPFTEITWTTPENEEIRLSAAAISASETFDVSQNISLRKLMILNKNWKDWFVLEGNDETSHLWALFAPSESKKAEIQRGTYQIRIDTLLFEEDNQLDAEIVMLGKVYGLAGTDYMRRDLMFPLLWGMPFVILFGLLGAFVTTALALFVSALGVWYGGWIDALIQRITEANMILPILAISILIHVIFQIDMLVVIGGVILMNVFGTPTKTFRAAFLQVKESLYIEAAQTYGASNWRLITHYMIPRILPVLVPQLVILVPGFIFLEATFGMFNIKSDYPTWGRIIYEALKYGAYYGSRYWVLEPLALLLLTGFAFTLLGSALDKVLNPKLQK